MLTAIFCPGIDLASVEDGTYCVDYDAFYKYIESEQVLLDWEKEVKAAEIRDLERLFGYGYGAHLE